jgi:NAD(P)-dependent dehydrogenase (short-subunit alcohol dehydrogenase family)
LVRATAIAFGAAGANVVFSDVRSVEGEETAALIRETGAECLFVKSDVSSEADVQALVQKRSLLTASSIVPLTTLGLIWLLNRCTNNR